MSDPLFRVEALEYLANQAGPGELLRVSPRWMNAAYWTFLLFVCLGVLASVVVRVDGEPLLFVLLPVLNRSHA
jgi:hypothetical protein